MLSFPAFLIVQLVVAFSLAASSMAVIANIMCDDAIKRSTNLCQKWKSSGYCGVPNVRAFCQKSCNLCRDEDLTDDDDVAETEYLGCFKDGVQSELKLMPRRLQITVRSCIQTCGSQNFKFAGLRSGRYCLCGNDYGSYGEVRKRDGCSKRCGSKEPCGGTMENALYRAEFKRKNKRVSLENIEKLVLGKKRVDTSKRRPHHKPHVKMTIPNTREWDFDSWLRKYEEQKEQDAQKSY